MRKWHGNILCRRTYNSHWEMREKTMSLSHSLLVGINMAMHFLPLGGSVQAQRLSDESSYIWLPLNQIYLAEGGAPPADGMEPYL